MSPLSTQIHRWSQVSMLETLSLIHRTPAEFSGEIFVKPLTIHTEQNAFCVNGPQSVERRLFSLVKSDSCVLFSPLGLLHQPY